MTQTKNSNAEVKRALMPKLRFAEFRSAPEWQDVTMGEIYTFKSNNSLSREKLNYTSGALRNIHYGDIHTRFSTLFDLGKESVPFINLSEPQEVFRPENDCAVGDMVFADASEDLDDIGKSIEIVQLNGERVVAGLHTILARPYLDRIAVGFGGHLFQSRRVRSQIQRESQGSKVLGISASRLSRISLAIPPTKAEQQKIAECLSTLDELIDAESQKLDALKTHKQGLMQRLFPREGETLPRLRFPEFQNAPEWQAQSIGDFGEIVTGSTPSTAKPKYYGGSIPFASPADIGELRFVSKTRTTLSILGFAKTRQVRANSTLFVCIGSTIGKVAQAKFDCATNQQINSVIPSPLHDDDFVYYALLHNADRVAKLAGKQAVPIVNKSLFSSVQVLAPKRDEQRQTASFLSAIDDLIAAQSDKLEALKTHKKGLMQQLFPAPVEPQE